MTLGQHRRFFAPAGLVVLCAVAADYESRAASPDSGQIVMKNYMFAPSSVTIKAGASVTWVNKDHEPHAVSSDTGLFRSSAVDTDETFSFKFDKPGTYHFTCSIHPRMVGTIIVE
jgi:plastocyanin